MSQANSIVTNPRPESLQFTRFGGVNVPASEATNVHASPGRAKIPATAAVTGPMFATTGNQILFNIPSKVQHVTHMHVELPITNTNAVAATPKVYTITPSGVPATGSFSIIFPDFANVNTGPLLGTATTAQIQAAIDVLHPELEGQITVGGTLATAVTLTGSAALRDFKVEVSNFGLATVVPAAVTLVTTISTAWAAGGSLIVGRSPVLFERVEWLANNQVYEDYHGEEIFQTLILTKKEEDLANRSGRQMGWDFQRRVSLNFINGASGTATIRVPLLGMMINQNCKQAKIVPAALPKFQFQLRIILRGATSSIFSADSGTTATFADLSVGTPQLYVEWIEYEPMYLNALRASYSSGFGIRHYEKKMLQLETSATLTAGVERTTHLSGMHGDFSIAQFILRPTAKTNDNHWFQPLRLSFIDVQDENEKHLLGDDQRTPDYDMRYQVVPARFPEMYKDLNLHYNFYLWCPSIDPVMAEECGVMKGAYRAVGKDRVLWTPTAAAAAQTELVVYYNNLHMVIFTPDGKVDFK